MNEIVIREVADTDRREWYLMRAQVWPDTTDARHTLEMEGYLDMAREGNDYRVFVADAGDGKLVGLVEFSIGVAENADAEIKFGKIEGLHVANDCAAAAEVLKQLILTAEDWTREQECREIWSDTKSDNNAPALNAFLDEGYSIHARITRMMKTF